MRRYIPSVLGLFMLLGVARRAPADAFDGRLDSLLRSRSPRAESLFTQANQAREGNNSFLAIDLYDRVLQLVPDFGPASRRQAMERLRVGQREAALEQLHGLLRIDSSSYTHSALAMALVTTPEGVEPLAVDLDAARAHALRAVELDPDASGSWQALWRVAFVLRDHALMKRAIEGMARLAPREWDTWASTSVYELVEGKPPEAAAALERARQLGMPKTDADHVADWIAAAKGELQRAALIGFGAWSVGAWIVAFLVLMGAGLVLSGVTLRAAGRALSDPSGKVLGFDAWLRRIYRGVLWLCCAFYYVSIPLILLFVLGLGGGLIYLALSVGHIPIKLLLIVVFVTFVTVASIIRSLFVRGTDGDPGQRIDLAAYPRLRDLLDRVAARIGTRPADEVYLTPATEIAVMERGGMMRQMRGDARRCLILGIGVLDRMTIGQLKAILAHEYGHFSNRDTAGGGFALSVRRSLYAMAAQLAHGGVAGWFNPAWVFVRGFHAVFMRISQGASRLQEVLADRWAAIAFGSQAFAQALARVIESSVRFDVHAQATLGEVLKENRPLPNLYRYQPAEVATSEAISKTVDEVMTAEPSPFDSHPSPSQRLSWVHALDAAGEGASAEDEAEAWSLFDDREALEQRMTAYIRANVEAIHGVRFAE